MVKIVPICLFNVLIIISAKVVGVSDSLSFCQKIIEWAGFRGFFLEIFRIYEKAMIWLCWPIVLLLECQGLTARTGWALKMNFLRDNQGLVEFVCCTFPRKKSEKWSKTRGWYKKTMRDSKKGGF